MGAGEGDEHRGRIRKWWGEDTGRKVLSCYWRQDKRNTNRTIEQQTNQCAFQAHAIYGWDGRRQGDGEIKYPGIFFPCDKAILRCCGCNIRCWGGTRKQYDSNCNYSSDCLALGVLGINYELVLHSSQGLMFADLFCGGLSNALVQAVDHVLQNYYV